MSAVPDTASPPQAPAVVRPMRWWDIEQVAALERAVFTDDPWPAEGFWSELAGVPATRFYLVARAGQQVVGYAGLMVVGSAGDVQTLAVAPSYRHHGLGTALLEALLAQAWRRGAAAVHLEVRADNEAAIRLYTRHGFAPLSRRRGYYQPSGQDALVLRLLRPPAAGPATGLAAARSDHADRHEEAARIGLLPATDRTGDGLAGARAPRPAGTDASQGGHG
jgi:ribosomal-protein-alanine N-acetyltransferase